MREWARKLEAKPKYVVSASRRDFPWNNTFRVEGDLREGREAAQERRPRAACSWAPPALSAALERLGLIDEYRLVVHPILRGPRADLVSGPGELEAPRARLDEAPEVRRDGAALPPQS